MPSTPLATEDAPAARPLDRATRSAATAPHAAIDVSASSRASESGGSHRLGSLATGILVTGVLLAILTTTDAHWWQLHFSQLGTHQDFSGRAFNATMLAAGVTLAVYGAVIAVDLPSSIGRRRSRWMRVSMTSAGAHLTLIGLIPIPVAPALHDLAACGLVLSFISLAASSVGCRTLARRFCAFALCVVVVLAIGMTLLLCGFITLAAYEAVAFSLMGVWLLSLPRALAPAPLASRPSASGSSFVTPRWTSTDELSTVGRSASPGCVPAHSSRPAVAATVRACVANHHRPQTAPPRTAALAEAGRCRHQVDAGFAASRIARVAARPNAQESSRAQLSRSSRRVRRR